MPKYCKDCKFYGIDRDTVGLCLNSISFEYGRLVWPSMEACEEGKDKTIPISQTDLEADKKQII